MAKKPKKKKGLRVDTFKATEQRLVPSDLDFYLSSQAVDLPFRDAISGATLEESFDPSEFSITVRDPQRKLLQLDILSKRIDVYYDGEWYRYRTYRKSGSEVTLVFENQSIAWSRKYNKSRSIKRSKSTRAQFIKSMLREITEGDVTLWSPEQNIRQPIGVAQVSAKATKKKGKNSGKGFSAGVSLTVGGVPATPAQVRTADSALSQCADSDCSRRVMIAVTMALTQETKMGKANLKKPGPSTNGGKTDDIGYLQQGRPWIGVSQSQDVKKCVRAFLFGNRAGVGGTAKDPLTNWTRVHGSQRSAPGDLNAAIIKVQGSVGGYGQWLEESTNTVDRWLTGNNTYIGRKSSTQREEKVAYRFGRGVGQGKQEDTYVAARRLADEVRWRLWPMRGGQWWLATDEFLLSLPAGATIEPTTRGVIDIDGDIESGKVPSELTMTCRTITGLPIGSHIVLKNWGVLFDGSWLISRCFKDLFKGETSVTLTQPVLSLKEPEEESSGKVAKTATVQSLTKFSSGNKGKAQRVHAEAAKISAKRYPYSWGGGHGSHPNPSNGINQGTHQDAGVFGYDCSSSVGAALQKAGFSYDGRGSGGFGALPGMASGRGKYITIYYNSTHVWMQFEAALGVAAKRFDTVGPGESGPRNRSTARTDQGNFKSCHPQGL